MFIPLTSLKHVMYYDVDLMASAIKKLLPENWKSFSFETEIEFGYYDEQEAIAGLMVQCSRLETEQEVKARLREEQAAVRRSKKEATRTRDEELRLYKRLKKKFEK